jgi:hypothetical protein
VINLRCTASLLKKLGGPATPDTPSFAQLGDWDARVVATHPQHLVLCTNERTLLCVVVPFAPARHLSQRFAEAARRMIERIPAPPAVVAREIDALAEIRLGRATNRSVRSSMTHFGYAVASWFEMGRPLDLDALSLWLCDTPCFPLETTWPWLEAELVLTGSVAPGRRPFKFREI